MQLTMPFRSCACALLAWLLGATVAHASSPWIYGTIVSAEVDAEGKPHLVLLVVMDNYLRGPEQVVREIRMQPLTTVSLDGTASTFAEACKPGRAATYFQRQTVYGQKGNHLLVSTQAGPSVPVALESIVPVTV